MIYNTSAERQTNGICANYSLNYNHIVHIGAIWAREKVYWWGSTDNLEFLL